MDHNFYRNFIGALACPRFTFAEDPESANRYLTGEPMHLQLPPLPKFRVVKCITFYAQPQRAERPSGDAAVRAMIDMTLEGPTEFVVHPPTGGAKACYRFNPDPIHISHSLFKAGGGVVLHPAVQRDLFRTVPLGLNRGRMRRPHRRMGLPANRLHARLPKR